MNEVWVRGEGRYSHHRLGNSGRGSKETTAAFSCCSSLEYKLTEELASKDEPTPASPSLPLRWLRDRYHSSAASLTNPCALSNGRARARPQGRRLREGPWRRRLPSPRPRGGTTASASALPGAAPPEPRGFPAAAAGPPPAPRPRPRLPPKPPPAAQPRAAGRPLSLPCRLPRSPPAPAGRPHLSRTLPRLPARCARSRQPLPGAARSSSSLSLRSSGSARRLRGRDPGVLRTGSDIAALLPPQRLGATARPGRRSGPEGRAGRSRTGRRGAVRRASPQARRGCCPRARRGFAPFPEGTLGHVRAWEACGPSVRGRTSLGSGVRALALLTAWGNRSGFCFTSFEMFTSSSVWLFEAETCCQCGRLALRRPDVAGEQLSCLEGK